MCCNQSLHYASVVCSPSFPSWCRSLALQIDDLLHGYSPIMMSCDCLLVTLHVQVPALQAAWPTGLSLQQSMEIVRVQDGHARQGLQDMTS